jgi:hypothetical protein
MLDWPLNRVQRIKQDFAARLRRWIQQSYLSRLLQRKKAMRRLVHGNLTNQALKFEIIVQAGKVGIAQGPHQITVPGVSSPSEQR